MEKTYNERLERIRKYAGKIKNRKKEAREKYYASQSISLINYNCLIRLSSALEDGVKYYG